MSKELRKRFVKTDTLCWDCKNATGGCSWSSSFVPVEGWDATKTIVKVVQKEEESYIVRKCPLFERG
jgi:hypothetical protein